jgi:hypothetical protein
MGAAITLLVILTFSIVVVRIAAVALRLTGVPTDVARFQARSAFTGAGFTTSESEAIVNHPIRRRLIALLMVLGNVGLISVLGTFIVSFVATENSISAISQQLFWLLGAIAFLWFIVLNPLADRVMCTTIGWLLQRTTSLGQEGPTELLQVTNGYSVAEHSVIGGKHLDGTALEDLRSDGRQFLVLGIAHDDGRYASAPVPGTRLVAGDRLILYGSDEEHSALHEEIAATEERKQSA